MIQENVSLKPFNTFGVEVSTKFFAEAKTITELEEILAWYRDQTDCSLLILGGGSNLLFTRNWEGLTLKISLKGRLVADNIVTAAAGEDWHQFVLWTLNQKLYGLENLSLIPGQVGTAPMQNIGAYGVEIKDLFGGLEAINIKTGERKIFTKEDCQFGYRESVLKNREKGQWIIISVLFELLKEANTKTDYGTIKTVLEAHKITNPTPEQVSQAVTTIRESKLPDPKLLGSAGSFFKNPVVSQSRLDQIKITNPDVPHYAVVDGKFKLPAAYLIDQAGWKGKTFGSYGVHKDQPLVIVNYGGAKGGDIWQLALDIQASVKERFGVELTPEVNVI